MNEQKKEVIEKTLERVEDGSNFFLFCLSVLE